MNTPTKVVGFVAGLAALFGAAFVVGTATGPLASTDSDSGHHAENHDGAAAQAPGGLMASEAGYTVKLDSAPTSPGSASELQFHIENADGKTVTEFTTAHGKKLHLIVVRRDLAYYQHLHPKFNDGVWSVAATLPASGQYRMFADFRPADRDTSLTLGTDFAIAGDYQPIQLPAADTTATVDGYQVTLSGEIRAGSTNKLTMRVSKDGNSVTDLEPYLGAYGHLVALRDGDLAYLHVHPDGEPGDGKTTAGPEIVFYAQVPTQGNYRLNLDFQHEGKVRTAEFTVSVSATATDAGSATDAGPHHHG